MPAWLRALAHTFAVLSVAFSPLFSPLAAARRTDTVQLQPGTLSAPIIEEHRQLASDIFGPAANKLFAAIKAGVWLTDSKSVHAEYAAGLTCTIVLLSAEEVDTAIDAGSPLASKQWVLEDQARISTVGARLYNAVFLVKTLEAGLSLAHGTLTEWTEFGEHHSVIFILDRVPESEWLIVESLSATDPNSELTVFSIEAGGISVVDVKDAAGSPVVLVVASSASLSWGQRIRCAALGLRWSAMMTACLASVAGCIGSGGAFCPAAIVTCCAAIDWFNDVLGACGVQTGLGVQVFFDIVSTLCFFVP